MKKTFQLKAIVFFAVALFVSTMTFAQDAAFKPKSATNESVQGKIGEANVTITYGSPSLQGRKILGSIEPYGKPWRAGGNASTTFTTDKDLTVGGQKLPAGKYSIFMVPDEKEWKVMFNSQTGQWGIRKDTEDKRGYVANIDPSKNVIVLTVKPKAAGPTEKLKYEIKKDGIALVWENVEIPVSIK